MNPLAFVGLAICGLLAIFIYLGVNERSTRNIELNQEKHELESMKFDKEFSDFLDNKKIESPDVSEIEAKKSHINELETKKRLADAENEKRLAEMQGTLDQMSGYEKKE